MADSSKSSTHLLKQNSGSNPPTNSSNDSIPDWAYNGSLGNISGIPLLKGPFTTTLFFNYFDSFLTGLNLKTWYNSSKECLEPTYFLIDDGYFVRANVTSKNRTLLGMVLNVTKVMGTNFADIFPNCVMFLRSINNQT
jgi:hypothetical protein